MRGRIVLGVVFVLVGFVLLFLDFFVRVWTPSIWGLILLALGVALLLNRGEDWIEQRNDDEVSRKGMRLRRARRVNTTLKKR